MVARPAAVTEFSARAAGSGIVCMCAGIFCLAVSDALAKWLGAHYATVQIIFFRMLFGLVFVTGVGWYLKGQAFFHTARPLANAGRGFLAAGAAFCFIFGLTLVPLAKATTLAFVAPIFVTALSAPLLGEHVRLHSWVAVLIGFVGVLVVVRPSMTGLEPGALIVLAAAFFYALLMLSANRMPHEEDPWTMTFFLVLVPFVASAVALPWFWRAPRPEHLIGFVAVGIAGTSAMLLLTQAFRLGRAAVVAPFDYTGLIWAVLFGWLFWAEIPDPWALAGALIIITSGFYLIHRETRNKGYRDASLL